MGCDPLQLPPVSQRRLPPVPTVSPAAVSRGVHVQVTVAVAPAGRGGWGWEGCLRDWLDHVFVTPLQRSARLGWLGVPVVAL
jgi:hypothetical protein